MILFKSWAKHKVKSHIYCVNQFLREKRHKKWNRECKQKQSLLFNFCNIFDLVTSRTQQIAWWRPVFKPDFYIFSYVFCFSAEMTLNGYENLCTTASQKFFQIQYVKVSLCQIIEDTSWKNSSDDESFC